MGARDVERLGVDFLDFRTHLERTATAAVVIARHIDESAGGKVGIEVELAAFDIVDGGVEYFVEVVGQDFGRQTHGYAFAALSQQQGEFRRKGHRFVFAAVVAHCPLGNLGAVEHLKGERRKACLDVSCGSGGAAGEDVAPVSLRLDKQLFLSELHQSVLY